MPPLSRYHPSCVRLTLPICSGWGCLSPKSRSSEVWPIVSAQLHLNLGLWNLSLGPARMISRSVARTKSHPCYTAFSRPCPGSAGISIKDQELMRMLCTKRIPQLLRNPPTTRMFRDAAVQDAPTIMSDHKESYNTLKLRVGTLKKSIAVITPR